MPAVQLARLRRQTAELREFFPQPEVLLRRLRDLLEFYADRTRRPGQSGKPAPLIRMYQAPRQVLRQIGIDLQPQIHADPGTALALADLLWADGWLETRLLAIDILAEIPLQDTVPTLTRMRAWAGDCLDTELLDALFAVGRARLWGGEMKDFLHLIDEWASSAELDTQKLALRAISVLVADPGFENLPVVMRLLQPYVRAPLARLEADTLQVIQALVRRSPLETAYFLQQGLLASQDARTARLVRQSLPDFPVEVQQELKARLREQRYSISD
ncbi:MAG: DNA alkylation repair protein [Anaerolineales bacterium]|nr:DNA alkylation repair protein [Anaerolineales bacterium]